MVQNKGSRTPGRPREYDPEVALQRAMETFWEGGFSGTSLDDLGERMGMNRPSVYAAFGDKEALYLKTLESYIARRRAGMVSVLRADRPLRDSLSEMYGGMIDWFVEGDSGARGCYLLGTAVTEALGNARVRELLVASQKEMDMLLRKAFSVAQARGEIRRDADPKALATLASALSQTLALRARAGQPRAQLRELADASLDVICQAQRRSK